MAKASESAARVDARLAQSLERLHSNELSSVVRYLHYAHMIFGANRIPYGLRYPHEKGSIVAFGFAALSLARKMAPSQMPRPVALSKASTVAPERAVPWGEYPLVMCPSPETNTLVLSLICWHGISCWLAPLLLSWPTTPEFVVDPCDQ